MRQNLFTGQTTDGQSTPCANTDETAQAIVITGTFTAGTLKLQVEDPQAAGTWVDLDGTAWTAVGGYSLALPRDIRVRADLSGFTGTLNVTVL